MTGTKGYLREADQGPLAFPSSRGHFALCLPPLPSGSHSPIYCPQATALCPEQETCHLRSVDGSGGFYKICLKFCFQNISFYYHIFLNPRYIPVIIRSTKHLITAHQGGTKPYYVLYVTHFYILSSETFSCKEGYTLELRK